MNTQVISRKNLKQIYDVACASWKTKLEGYTNRDGFESEIELTQKEIDEMYAASDEKQIKLLDKFFTKPKSIKDSVKGYESACKVLGISYEKRSWYDRLCIIIKALNEGWFPDFNDSTNKYWNYFYMKGGVFSYYNTNYNTSNVGVPSALYLKNIELAKYAAEIAFEEYKNVYLNKY